MASEENSRTSDTLVLLGGPSGCIQRMHSAGRSVARTSRRSSVALVAINATRENRWWCGQRCEQEDGSTRGATRSSNHRMRTPIGGAHAVETEQQPTVGVRRGRADRGPRGYRRCFSGKRKIKNKSRDPLTARSARHSCRCERRGNSRDNGGHTRARTRAGLSAGDPSTVPTAESSAVARVDPQTASATGNAARTGGRTCECFGVIRASKLFGVAFRISRDTVVPAMRPTSSKKPCRPSAEKTPTRTHNRPKKNASESVRKFFFFFRLGHSLPPAPKPPMATSRIPENRNRTETKKKPRARVLRDPPRTHSRGCSRRSKNRDRRRRSRDAPSTRCRAAAPPPKSPRSRQRHKPSLPRRPNPSAHRPFLPPPTPRKH